MKPPATRLEHLFIVRLWSETSAAEHKRWRGSVEHIPGKQFFYFTSLHGLTDFISLHLESPPQPSKKGGDISIEKEA